MSKKLTQQIKELALKHRTFVSYIVVCVIVTVADVLVCRALEVYAGFKDKPEIANIFGNIAGFLLQFVLSRQVFLKQNIKTFAIYLSTFVFGIFFAAGIVYFFRHIIFDGINTRPAFIISKLASIVIPFFLLYFMRKKLIERFG